MPQTIIYCSECAAKTKSIEETGRWRVTSCEPTPSDARKCVITWERRRRTGAGAQDAPATPRRRPS